MKLLIPIIFTVLAGCSTCQSLDTVCQQNEANRRAAALMYFGNAMQQQAARPIPQFQYQPIAQPPKVSPPADVWTARMFDPQRGTQYCNQQGLCMWK